MKLESIIKKLQNMLPERRVKHSENVAKCAIKLSDIYGCDKEKSYIAGIVHDCAKYLDTKEIDIYVNKYSIELDELEKNNLALSHSVIGSYIVRNEFSIDDEEIINSVKYHTTGKANMSLLEKIIYIADLIEEDRNFPGLENLRELTYNGQLDEALLMSFDNTIKFVIDNKQLIHPRTVEARNYLMKKNY